MRKVLPGIVAPVDRRASCWPRGRDTPPGGRRGRSASAIPLLARELDHRRRHAHRRLRRVPAPRGRPYAGGRPIEAGRAGARDEEDLVLLTRARSTRAASEARAMRARHGAPIETFSGGASHLVQFARDRSSRNGTLRPAATGAEIVTYIPHNTYLVCGDEESLGRVRALGSLRAMGRPFRGGETASILARRADVVGRMNVAGSDLTPCSSWPIPRRTKPRPRSSTPSASAPCAAASRPRTRTSS